MIWNNFYLNIFYICIYSCDDKAEFSAAITPIFSFISFRIHCNMLICCSNTINNDGSCAIEDWSNDAENSISISKAVHRRNKLHFKIHYKWKQLLYLFIFTKVPVLPFNCVYSNECSLVCVNHSVFFTCSQPIVYLSNIWEHNNF